MTEILLFTDCFMNLIIKILKKKMNTCKKFYNWLQELLGDITNYNRENLYYLCNLINNPKEESIQLPKNTTIQNQDFALHNIIYYYKRRI